eukprot:910997-Alexandrium_andersonii.AAC.1
MAPPERPLAPEAPAGYGPGGAVAPPERLEELFSHQNKAILKLHTRTSSNKNTTSDDHDKSHG